MLQRRAKSKFLPLELPVAVLAAIAILVPAGAAAAPGVDEYSLDIPDARGERHAEGSEQQRPAGALSPAVRAALAADPEGPALARIATSKALGAPDSTRRSRDGVGHAGIGTVAGTDAGDEPSDRSLLAVAADVADEPPALALLAILGVIAGGAALIARRRRQGSL